MYGRVTPALRPLGIAPGALTYGCIVVTNAAHPGASPAYGCYVYDIVVRSDAVYTGRWLCKHSYSAQLSKSILQHRIHRDCLCE